MRLIQVLKNLFFCLGRGLKTVSYLCTMLRILFCTLICAAAYGAGAQTTCVNPIQLNQITVVPATCGGQGGSVFFSVGSGDYTWNWTPSVSNGPIATQLNVGFYQVHIERNGQPECALDTTILITSNNGPTITVASIAPSNCLASNGVVQLQPATINYAWSNGEVVALNDGLNSGLYYVIGTDPVSGCASAIEVLVPNVNPLVFEATVTNPAKCGRNTGQATFTTSGGTGQYVYSLGGTIVNGLASGITPATVVDIQLGCQLTVEVNVPNVSAEGTVSVMTKAPNCHNGLGNANVEVTPGDNFRSPFTFSITDTNGTPQVSAGQLPPGNYLVYVADADSCLLPPTPFAIENPLPLVANVSTQNGNCSTGSQLSATATGGTGSQYFFDWTDLNGTINPALRQQVAEGRYQLVVFDSLFCSDTVSNLIINDLCPQTDTLHLLLTAGSTDSICLPIGVGLSVSEADVQLVQSGTSSSFGTWSINNNCLIFNALQNTGLRVQALPLRVNVPVINRLDTVVVLVSILPAGALSGEVVYFSAQINATAESCGTVPDAINNRQFLALNVSGLDGNTPFGQYAVQFNSGCLVYSAFNTIGFNLDSIAIAVCDPATLQCHVISYVSTVLPFFDCSGGVIAADTLPIATTNCLVGGNSCVEIPYANLLNFKIFDNGQPYVQGSLGCNEATVKSYAVANIPFGGSQGGGPYRLEEWFINGVAQTAIFSDLNELILLMNQLDPVPGWYLENFINIVGGQAGNTYGPLRITALNGTQGQVQPIVKTTPLGSELRFTTGDHRVVLQKIQTGCADTVQVRVQCFNCPPITNYTPNIFGNIEWDAPGCEADTLFCLNIPSAELSNWVITEAFQPVTNFVACGNNAALRLDTGYHELRLRNLLTTCEYTVPFFFDCRKAPRDTITANLSVGDVFPLCPDQSLVEAPVISVFNICPERSAQPNGSLTYDETNFCALYSASSVGTDTLCLQICNADGICATVLALVTVTAPPATADNMVRNGLSPNGDGSNDTWEILQIDRYPNHTVQVFDLNGHRVFFSQNYQNDWDGTWNQQQLPDGSYLYHVDLGDGSAVLTGVLFLMR
jgi:gliding motility-associated-like protein